MARLIKVVILASLVIFPVLMLLVSCSEEEFIAEGALRPLMSVRPDTVLREYSFGGDELESQYIQVRSSDALKQIRYEAISEASWLLLPIDTGTTPSELFVKISPTGLSDGTYIDSVAFYSDDADNAPVYTLFQLEIITSLVVDRPFITNWKSQADTLYPDTMIIESGGGTGFSAIGWEARHNVPTWLTLNKYSGTTPDTILIQYADTTFEVGSHRELIEFSSPDVRGTAQVTVQMNISSWTKQTLPAVYSNDLKSVSFVDEEYGWAVMFAAGASSNETVGIVVRTTDGGDTWEFSFQTDPNHLSPPIPRPRGLGGIHFVDRSNGWAVGQSGTIIHTSDGGARWDYQADQLSQGDDLQDVFFASTSRGWAVGKGGLFVRTEDGGSHWTGKFISGNPDLSDITFVNNLDGWFVGNRGTLQYTNNGGVSWLPSTLPSPYELTDLRAISFIDSDIGWVVGETGFIAKSTDGGRNWTVLDPGTTESFDDVEFITADRGWVVGNHSTVLSTDDGGATWSAQDFGGDGSFWFHALDFVNQTTGWVVGDDGTIFRARLAGKK
ncbi:MAG: YCF48-related protein [bacterium]|nr:YCF48-related protein [bacterium]